MIRECPEYYNNIFQNVTFFSRLPVSVTVMQSLACVFSRFRLEPIDNRIKAPRALHNTPPLLGAPKVIL